MTRKEIEPFSFIHCADLHLDSPFVGIHDIEPGLAARLREATFKAFNNIIDAGIRERVDFIIIAGDIYDGSDRSLLAQLRFREGLKRAVDSGIACYLAHGNHDPLSGWEAGLDFPDGVFRFGGDVVERFDFLRKGKLLTCIYGMSFPVREVKQNLSKQFRRGGGDSFAIAVLHCNVGGNPNHDNYAPCSVDDLIGSNMDYWALGHIHAAQILRGDRPAIIYPGNPQGRSIREAGARGCGLVRVNHDGDIAFESVETDCIRWFNENLEVADSDSPDSLFAALEKLRDDIRSRTTGRPSLLRVNLAGRGIIHKMLKKQEAMDDLLLWLRKDELERDDFVWLESTMDNTRPAVDVARRRETADFIGDFLRTAEKLRNNPIAATMIKDTLKKNAKNHELLEHLESLPDSELYAILGDAEAYGLDLLMPEQEG